MADELQNMPVDPTYQSNSDELALLSSLLSSKLPKIPQPPLVKKISSVVPPKVKEAMNEGYAQVATAAKTGGFTNNLKLSLIVGLLFLLFTLPFVTKAFEGWVHNAFFSKVILALVFAGVFFVIHQFWI